MYITVHNRKTLPVEINLVFPLVFCASCTQKQEHNIYNKKRKQYG